MFSGALSLLRSWIVWMVVSCCKSIGCEVLALNVFPIHSSGPLENYSHNGSSAFTATKRVPALTCAKVTGSRAMCQWVQEIWSWLPGQWSPAVDLTWAALFFCPLRSRDPGIVAFESSARPASLREPSARLLSLQTVPHRSQTATHTPYVGTLETKPTLLTFNFTLRRRDVFQRPIPKGCQRRHDGRD